MATSSIRINTLLLVLLVLMAGAIITMLATRAYGGPLDPPGPPDPTMKTLGDIPPSWHQTLLSDNGDVDGCNSTRFTCVLGNTSVLDNETGLVWDIGPATAGLTWLAAIYHCAARENGGRYGWRLPTLEEVMTLRDTSLDGVPDGAPLLPSGFLFWTSTTNLTSTTSAFSFSQLNGLSAVAKTGSGPRAACVRGPQSSQTPS